MVKAQAQKTKYGTSAEITGPQKHHTAIPVLAEEGTISHISCYSVSSSTPYSFIHYLFLSQYGSSDLPSYTSAPQTSDFIWCPLLDLLK